MKKKCPECGDDIIGREDKKFCCDGCRNAFHNKSNKDTTNFMRNINNRLRKNHRILSDLNTEGKCRTTRSKLLRNGFDFEYFTSIYKTRKGNTYYFLYDQGYMPLQNESYILMRKET